MPATSRAALFAIVLSMCGFTACKKEKTAPTVDETKLFKIYNNSGATLNLKIYRHSFDYIDDKNPAINIRFENNQFIYLEPTEFDAYRWYYVDFYNDDLTINNWGIGYNHGDDVNAIIRIAAGKSQTIYKHDACNARRVLLKDNKPTIWKAVNAFSGYTGARIWDTLSTYEKNYQLECKRHSIKLSHIKAPQDTIGWIYDPMSSSFNMPPGSSIFYGELSLTGGNPEVLIYNYSKPYIGNPQMFGFPGAEGTKDTVMVQAPDNFNHYMMVRQQ